MFARKRTAPNVVNPVLAAVVQPLACDTLLDAIGNCLEAGEVHAATADDATDYDAKHQRYESAIRAVVEIPCASLSDRRAKLELMRENLDEIWAGVAHRGDDPRAALDLMVEFGQEAFDVAMAIAEKAERGERHDLVGIPALMA